MSKLEKRTSMYHHDLFDTLFPEEEPRQRPKAGTVYMFKYTDESRKDDWRADGYRWRQSGSFGSTKPKKGNKINNMERIYFHVCDGPNHWTKAFTRIAYRRIDRPNVIVVEYSGDEAASANFPNKDHQASGTTNYIRKTIKKSTTLVDNGYQEMVLKTEGPCVTPRYLKQKKSPIDHRQLFDTLFPEEEARQNPKAGTVYLFKYTDESRKDDWRADGYRWRQSGSFGSTRPKKGLKKTNSMERIYFHVCDGPGHYTRAFTRVAYRRIDRSNSIVIEYNGDETVAANFPHGNQRASGAADYVRTIPHVLKEIKKSTAPALSVYREMVAANTDRPCAAPRNLQQVKNAQKLMRNRSRLSNDMFQIADETDFVDHSVQQEVITPVKKVEKLPRNRSRLTNDLFEIANDTDFVHLITVHPEVLVILSNPNLLSVFISTLDFSTPINKPLQQLTYDTFNLGDMYVSALLFCCTDFDPAPVIPLAFMIHKQKLTEAHDQFFTSLIKICPHLNNATNVIVVTDQETTSTAAIDQHLPSIKRFLCWNQLLEDCQQWLRECGINRVDEITVALDSIRDLLSCSTKDEYSTKLMNHMTVWSQPLWSMFVKRILPNVDRLGLWELQLFGLSNAIKHQSEGFNTALKRLNEWHDVPIDVMVLSLQQLTNSYVAEIRRGHSGLGKYTLRAGFEVPEGSNLEVYPGIAPDAVVNELCHLTVSPGGVSQASVDPSMDLYLEASSSTSEFLVEEGVVAVITSGETGDHAYTKESVVAADSSFREDPLMTNSSRASAIIASGRIALNPRLATFTITETNGPRVVRLFPKTTCSCSSQAPCYHVVAARMAVGLPEDQPQRSVSIAQLSINKRKKAAKMPGRKRAKVNDIKSVLVPVGDSGETVTASLVSAVHTPGMNWPTVVSSDGTHDEDIKVCIICKSAEPPLGGQEGPTSFVSCENCPAWVHCFCAGFAGLSNTCKYVCESCRSRHH